MSAVVMPTILLLTGIRPSAASPIRDPEPQPSDLQHRLTPSPLPVAALAPVCVPPRAGATTTPDSYKRDVACRIHARNSAQLYEGAPPPVLRSIVVLSLRIDASGRPVRIGVLRSNGIRALERRAIQSVRAAAPLPLPAGRMLKQGSADIVETWLFRDDGRFQVRTLAMVQAASGY
ncbi:MAG TPA: TonB family protein [Lautropia sp.]|nr:TonB family protein [Lautropia sp.]